MLTRFAESALKGDTKSAAFLLQRDDGLEAAQENANTATTQDEQEIMEAVFRGIPEETEVKRNENRA